MKLYDKVRHILETRPHTRSSDKALIWEVMTHYEDLSSVTKEMFDDCPAFESITRARRKVQELHPNLQAVQEVKTARDNKQSNYPSWVFRD